MLGPGAAVPRARVWADPLSEPVEIAGAIAGPGHALVCFYPFAFSPG